MLTKAIHALLDVIYPRICAACDNNQPVRDGIFCFECLASLPETNLHLYRDNFFTMHFWGRVPVEFGSAFLFYVPGGISQKLIHNIKYKRNTHYAEEVGMYYGKKLLESPILKPPDCIIPVPLHWKKEQQRGFNQSAAFGKGLSASLNIPLLQDVLIRQKSTSTQTSKSREERMANMADAFAIRRPKQLEQKHILLIDDVLTTGATLESCAHTLLEVPGVRISMVTMAMGRI